MGSSTFLQVQIGMRMRFDSITKHLSSIIFALSTLSFAVLALKRGQDASWDFRNYHYYNAYAFFNDRLSYDIAPAQIQTYFNPTLDLLPFLLTQHFPPFVLSLSLGAWHGLNVWLLFLIGRELFVKADFNNPLLWAVICAITGATGAATQAEVGMCLHDLTVSVFVLGAVWFYLRACHGKNSISDRPSLWHLSASGFLLGLSAGLKLSFAIYVLGMGMAVFVVQLAMLRQYKAFLIFVLSASSALLLAAGPWMWVLWKQFANPLFPMYNAFFQSPYYAPENTSDARFLPINLWEALSFPFKFDLTHHQGSELQFRDFRVTSLYVAMLLAGIYAIIRAIFHPRSKPIIAKSKDYPLMVFWLLIFIWTTYLVWLKQFAIYRYLVGIELLAPIALVCLASLFKPRSRFVQVVLGVILVLLVVNTKSSKWGRFHAESNGFFGVQVPAIENPNHAVVLMASDSPQSYVIPAFPKSVRFVRIEGNFIHSTEKTALTDQIRTKISESVDNLYLLTEPTTLQEGVSKVNEYLTDHTITINQCWTVTTKLDPISLCRLNVGNKGEPKP